MDEQGNKKLETLSLNKDSESDNYDQRQKEIATEDGWKPLNEWTSDKDKWLDARDYNLRGKFIDKFRTQAKQLSEVEQRISNLNTVHAAQINAQQQELMAKRDVLIEEANPKGVRAVEQQISNLSPQLPPALDPVLEQWNAANPWVDEDTPKASHAKAVWQQQLQIAGNTTSNAIAKVNAEIDKHFSDKNTAVPMTENGSTPRGNKTLSRTVSMSDVTSEELKMRPYFSHLKDDKAFLQAITDSRKL